jgi:hypothetical protein
MCSPHHDNQLITNIFPYFSFARLSRNNQIFDLSCLQGAYIPASRW